MVVCSDAARHRRQRGRARLLAHEAAARVHLDVAHALPPAQRVVVLAARCRRDPTIEPDARHGNRFGVELLLGDLADVAHHVRHGLAGRGRAGAARYCRTSPGSSGRCSSSAARRLERGARRTPPRAGSAPCASGGRPRRCLSAVERHDRGEPAQHRAQRVRVGARAASRCSRGGSRRSRRPCGRGSRRAAAAAAPAAAGWTRP